MYPCSGRDMVGSESSVCDRSYVRTFGCACLSVYFSRESTDDICYIFLTYAMVDLLVYISSVNFVCLINKAQNEST